MFIKGFVSYCLPVRKIEAEAKAIYEAGIAQDVFLFPYIIPLESIFTSEPISKFDHSIKVGDETIKLIKIKKLTYISNGGKVYLENTEGAGYLYFSTRDKANKDVLYLWTQEILALGDYDMFKMEI